MNYYGSAKQKAFAVGNNREMSCLRALLIADCETGTDLAYLVEIKGELRERECTE